VNAKYVIVVAFCPIAAFSPSVGAVLDRAVLERLWGNTAQFESYTFYATAPWSMCASSIHKVHGSDDRLCEAEVSRSKPRLGAAAAVAAALVMAGYVVLSKQFFGSGGSEVGAFLLARQLLASTLMLALAAGRHGCLLPRPEHRGALARLGFLNFFNAIGFVWGVKLTTAFVTSVMQLSIPVFSLVYSTLTGLEQLSLAKGGALLLTLLGCGIVAVGSAGEQSAAGAEPGPGPGLTPETGERDSLSEVVGMLVLAAQCMSFVGIIQVQKRVLDFYPVALVVGWSYAMCTAWSCAYCVLDRSILRLPELISASEHGVGIVLYSAIFGGAAGSKCRLGAAAAHHPGLLWLTLPEAEEAMAGIGPWTAPGYAAHPGTRRRAAQGPMRGCGAAVRVGPNSSILRRSSRRRGGLLRAGGGRHQAPQPDARRGLGRARAAVRLGHRHLLLRVLARAAAAACPKCPSCSPLGPRIHTAARRFRSLPARSGHPPAPGRSTPTASRRRPGACPRSPISLLLPSRLEVGGYCCAALGAASLAGSYSCDEEPPRHRGAFGGAPAFGSGGAALAELWPRSTSRGWPNEAGAQRALLSPDDDEACGVELEACSSRSPRAAYG